MAINKKGLVTGLWVVPVVLQHTRLRDVSLKKRNASEVKGKHLSEKLTLKPVF